MALPATDEDANADEEDVPVEMPVIITERELTDPAQEMARKIAGWVDHVSAVFITIIYCSLLLWTYSQFAVEDDVESKAGDGDAKLIHYSQQNLPPVGNALK